MERINWLYWELVKYGVEQKHTVLYDLLITIAIELTYPECVFESRLTAPRVTA